MFHHALTCSTVVQFSKIQTCISNCQNKSIFSRCFWTSSPKYNINYYIVTDEPAYYWFYSHWTRRNGLLNSSNITEFILLIHSYRCKTFASLLTPSFFKHAPCLLSIIIGISNVYSPSTNPQCWIDTPLVLNISNDESTVTVFQCVQHTTLLKRWYCL